MKKFYTLIICFCCAVGYAQVGIGTTNPNAQLDIQSSNQVAPSNTDGVLIPKIDAFPATNPGANQNGMLVFLTTTVGVNTPGFYYWDNLATAWVPIGNNSNSGWNLNGNTITAGQFVGTTNNEDVVFRRQNQLFGRLGTNITSFGNATLSNNTIGVFNVAIGNSALVMNDVGSFNTAVGGFALSDNTTGGSNTAVGSNALENSETATSNTAIGTEALRANILGNNNTGLGRSALNTNTVGNQNTAIGSQSDVSANNLTNATAIGANSQVNASNSLVLGSISGVNGATSTVNVGIGTGAPQERLHILGNIRMVDGNQGAGRILVGDANGTATWTNVSAISSGTLDQAYDFGGAGNGRIITADNGAVLVNGDDGFVSTGTWGTGDVAPSGPGVRMVWNPNKVAFRAGMAQGNEWDDPNIGEFSTAFGVSAIASGVSSISMGGASTASGDDSIAMGAGAVASSQYSTAIGLRATSNQPYCVAIGRDVLASGLASTALGYYTTASGNFSTVFGNRNSALSCGETVLGIGATNYTLTANGATQFRAANATDRLFVIGNAIDSNNNGEVDNSERSDAMVVLKNGNTGIGISVPSQRLQVTGGNITVTTGDIYLSGTNGVFNAGGGLMTAAMNYIGDAYTAPTQVNGDEDLYIADDLELGGQGYKPGGGAWAAPSDLRLKTNIQPYAEGLQSLLQINPVTYKYNSVFKTLDTGETYIGVIAQEVKEIVPYMVNEKPFGQIIEEDQNGNERIVNQGTNYMTFDSSAFTYMLINAAKELNASQDTLKQENITLKAELESQRKLLFELKLQVEKLERSKADN